MMKPQLLLPAAGCTPEFGVPYSENTKERLKHYLTSYKCLNMQFPLIQKGVQIPSWVKKSLYLTHDEYEN